MKQVAKKVVMFPVNLTILTIFSPILATVMLFIFLLHLIFSPREAVRELKEDIDAVCNKISNIFVRN